MAATTNVPESIIYPEDTIDVNIKGTFNVLEACSAADVKNFVFASSSAAYGEPRVLPVPEEKDPLSPYGASKIAAVALVSSRLLLLQRKFKMEYHLEPLMFLERVNPPV